MHTLTLKGVRKGVIFKAMIGLNLKTMPPHLFRPHLLIENTYDVSTVNMPL